MAWPAYTWDREARQYRDTRGRFARREDVRAAVDATIDGAADEMEAASRDLQSGAIDLAEWQGRMEAIVKSLYVAAGAAAAGGWAQATPGDWGTVGARVARQYRYLRNFALELEAGLPLDGRFLARARMYARGAPATYEAVLRRGDLAAGFDEERRRLGTADHCADCPAYAAMGWQPIGTLPGIGEACACRGNCACSFERRRRAIRNHGSRSMPIAQTSAPRFAAATATTKGPLLVTLQDAGPPPAPAGLDRLDREKCRQRNRVAARRDGVNAVPVRLYAAAPPAAAAPRRTTFISGTWRPRTRRSSSTATCSSPRTRSRTSPPTPTPGWRS
jgi:hypothetical protein